ncbi:MAG: hypothetical protein A3J93_03550 [Candidatus Magasanikbacteria bacterium RIFOXYC2_FULL_42_28]|uniref:Uncharacterized protein n=1 Tax=Candidatus Magasanikbacteria bacterium RIFOXYC2_FULL_42_28 TaxID=1798704 RepID=A0A1F6NV36_9BACT|nr:MAG: hypothetical protein A3J93_03550 [Candidatus Magasanikbacteria bacterium RIFOXYC2_FULL_42_28]
MGTVSSLEQYRQKIESEGANSQPPKKELGKVWRNVLGDARFNYVDRQYGAKRFTAGDVDKIFHLINAEVGEKEDEVSDEVVNDIKADKTAVALAKGQDCTSSIASEVKGLRELWQFFVRMANASSITGGEYSAAKMFMVDDASVGRLKQMNQIDFKGQPLNSSAINVDTANAGAQYYFVLDNDEGKNVKEIFEKHGHNISENKNGPGFQAEMGRVRFAFLYVEMDKDLEEDVANEKGEKSVMVGGEKKKIETAKKDGAANDNEEISEEKVARAA